MKGNLLLGTARGKMGDIVGKVVHGKQVFAKYQPVVFNPKSTLQQEVRSVFTKGSQNLKELNNVLKSEGFDFRYNLYSGASKSLRNIFFDFIFQANRIGVDGANLQEIKMISPLTIESATGNYLPAIPGFDVPVGLFPFFGVDPFSPGTNYFGSDVPLDTQTRVIMIGSETNPPYYDVKKDSNFNLSLSMADRTTAIGIAKSNGFKTTIAECGEWNYIYSVDGSGIMEGASGIPYEDGGDYGFYLYYFWVDVKGRIIFAGSLSKFGAIPVTP